MRVATRQRGNGTSVTGQSPDRPALRRPSPVAIDTKARQPQRPFLALALPSTVTPKRLNLDAPGTLVPQAFGARFGSARDRPKKVRTILLEESEEGERRRRSHPFKGLLTATERDRVFEIFAKEIHAQTRGGKSVIEVWNHALQHEPIDNKGNIRHLTPEEVHQRVRERRAGWITWELDRRDDDTQAAGTIDAHPDIAAALEPRALDNGRIGIVLNEDTLAKVRAAIAERERRRCKS